MRKQELLSYEVKVYEKKLDLKNQKFLLILLETVLITSTNKNFNLKLLDINKQVNLKYLGKTVIIESTQILQKTTLLQNDIYAQ